MAFKRRQLSKTVTKAQVRLSAMKQIDTEKGRTIDYGDTDRPLTQAEMAAKLDACEKLVELYNQLLEQADKVGNQIAGIEAEIEEMFTAVLKSGVSKFGSDSSEVEMLGGTRKSERKRPVRKPKAE